MSEIQKRKMFEQWDETQYVYPYTMKIKIHHLVSGGISIHFSSKIEKREDTNKAACQLLSENGTSTDNWGDHYDRCTPARAIGKPDVRPHSSIKGHRP